MKPHRLVNSQVNSTITTRRKRYIDVKLTSVSHYTRRLWSHKQGWWLKFHWDCPKDNEDD